MDARWIQGGMLAASMVAMLAVLPAGCNNSDSPDTSDLNGYFESHPYVSDPRSNPTRVVNVAPVSATLNVVSARAVFTVTGGTAPYGWDVADSSIGSISPSGDSEAVYTAVSVGANDVIVHDRNGNAAIAEISGTAATTSTLSITATPSTLATDNALSVLKVTGGSAPFTWTVTDPLRGNFPSGNTGATVVYKRFTTGDNAATVRDGAGNTTSIVISQP